MTLDNRHKFARPYWARPGVSLFAKKVDDDDEGGAGGDDDDSDDDSDDDEDDDEDDLGDLSEDELRAELKKTRESLSKASGSSKKKRDTIKNLRAEIAKRPPATSSKKKADDDDEVDVEAIKASVKAEERAASDTRIRKTAARSELKAAGIPAEQVNRLVGMLDLDSLDVDDEGEVDGLDEAIEELKADWPQLFNKRPAKRRRESVAGGGESQGGNGKRVLTPSQIQAARATGKRAS